MIYLVIDVFFSMVFVHKTVIFFFHFVTFCFIVVFKTLNHYSFLHLVIIVFQIVLLALAAVAAAVEVPVKRQIYAGELQYIAMLVR